MGKKNYERPFMSVELFRPNEYVCACAPELVALEDVSNGKTYHLVLNGPVPAVGSGVGAHMAEASTTGFTAYNCGNGHWVIMGAITDGHSYSPNTVNGEFNFTGNNGLQVCTDPIHKSLLDYDVSGDTSHHHFREVILKNPLSFTVTDEIDDAYVKNYGYRSNPEYASCKELIKGYVQAGLDAFIYDYPEVFWFSKVSFAYENLSRESGSYSENPDGSTTLTIRKFSITSPFLFWTDAAEQTGAFRNAVSAAVSEVSGMIPDGASTGMKAKILADYVRQICDYEEGTYSHVAYGVFCGGGKVVCEGYAKAFKILCDRFGIDCALVPGELTVNGAAEPHMWTAVKTDDGLWRIVDPTLNDSSMNKTAYTLVGTETEIGSRTIAQQRSAYDAFSDTPYARIFLTPPIAADAYHERTETFREEPTCEENGSSTEECVIHDGETIEAEIPATGHSFSEWKTVKAAACEEAGTQERTCSACSKKEAREIPAAGHSFSAWKTRESTSPEIGRRLSRRRVSKTEFE